MGRKASSIGIAVAHNGDLTFVSRESGGARLRLSRGFLLVLAVALPLTLRAGDTWEFVDGEGVLHMGNNPVEEASARISASASDEAEAVATQPAGRELRWINRTWPIRYPVWMPPAEPSPETVQLLGAPNAVASRVPRGFNDVKPYLDAAAQSHAVDPALIYSVAAAESAFNTDAVSHKGALGLMQIMPATAARYGVTGYSLSTGRHNVLEPQMNAQVGSRYLADLLRRYGGDATLAIAAYNAGEGAVSKYGNKIPPYPETQKYVERVMGYYRSFKQ